MMRATLLLTAGLLLATGSAAQESPYVGLESREIKALSQRQIDHRRVVVTTRARRSPEATTTARKTRLTHCPLLLFTDRLIANRRLHQQSLLRDFPSRPLQINV